MVKGVDWYQTLVHDAYMLVHTRGALFGSLLSVAVSFTAGCTSDSETAAASAPRVVQQPARRERAFVAPTRRSRPAPAPASRATATTSTIIKGGLASANWMVRLTATSSLGCLPGSQALTWLERQLADVEPDVRAAAIESLRFRTEARALSLLVSVQDDDKEDLSLRVLAAAAVSRPITPCR